MAANVFGAYIKFTTDAFHSQTFTQTYDDHKARIELEEERERQVRTICMLVLSI